MIPDFGLGFFAGIFYTCIVLILYYLIFEFNREEI
jgi:hypothetical protein